MTVRLRNTLGRRVEPLEPADGKLVRMYTCGPTVYRHAHIGNLRTFMLADFIRRALLYHGLDVLHVKNITDVGHMRDEHHDHGGDRVLVQAELEGRSALELAAHYEAEFHHDEALVNILPAHVFPRATEHIPEMISIAERLQDLELAYATDDGTLYYDVSRFTGYGQLSGNTLDKLRAGHRGVPDPQKDDPADFALWKVSEPSRREFSWPTPRWGTGFPGWHLECSAMSLRYLGEQYDLHTGGIDNIFPHHEDEIAQSAPLTGDVPARLWVHGEHLLTSGRKMAKSAGNFQRITDLELAGIEPLALRYLALTARYAHKLHASEDSLRAADAALGSLRSKLRSLGSPPDSGPWAAPAVLEAHPAGERPGGVALQPGGHGSSGDDLALRDRAHTPAAPLSPTGAELHRRFVDAVDEDLDLPAALAVVRETLRAELADDEKRWLVLDADLLLGLDLHRAWQPAQVPASRARKLIAARAEARAAGNYEKADALRDELRRLGVSVADRPIDDG